MKALLPLALAAFHAIGALSAPSDEPQLPWDAPSWRPAPGMRVPYGVITIAISVIPRFVLRVVLGSKIPCKSFVSWSMCAGFSTPTLGGNYTLKEGLPVIIFAYEPSGMCCTMPAG